MMKRMAAALLAAVLTVSSGVQGFTDRNMVYAAEEEENIPEGYTAIYDIADLYAIRNDLSGSYILMNDIDMTADTSEGGDYDCGTGWDSIEQFSGVLDGNGHRIIGMHIFGNLIPDSFDEIQTGLFVSLYNATIENIGLVDCSIDVTLNNEDIHIDIGGITGNCDDSIIRNCYSEGKIRVKGQGGLINVGGLVGNDSTYSSNQIENCYNACDIDCSETKIREGNTGHLGGIYGCNQTIVNVSQSYNIGNISGNEQFNMGAICGYASSKNPHKNPYKNCQYLKGTAFSGTGNQNDNSDSVPLTENQMKNAKLFTGYDFTDTWEIDPYCSYPYPQLKNNRMIRVKSVNLTTAPAKLVYNQGETLSISDSVLEIEYEDGIKTSIPLSLEMLDGYDMMQIGTQTVNVTYGGVKTSFQIEVKEIPVSSITIPETLSIY